MTLPSTPLRIGVGGPVGSGKTALVAALCRELAPTVDLSVVTNDIYTTEDADFLRRRAVLPDERIRAALPASIESVPATDADWGTEYMDLDLAVAMVDTLDDAVSHIRKWSTGHTEAILTNDLANAERFIAEIDSAAVIVNASTRFTDGGEFGFGAEIGISTQKLHARGPMGLPELTSTTYVVTGEGHVRQ